MLRNECLGYIKVVISRSYRIITSQLNRPILSNSPPYFHSIKASIHPPSSSFNPQLDTLHLDVLHLHTSAQNAFVHHRNRQHLLPDRPKSPPKIRQDFHRRRRELSSYPTHYPSIPILFHHLITQLLFDDKHVPCWYRRLREQTQRRRNGPTTTGASHPPKRTTELPCWHWWSGEQTVFETRWRCKGGWGTKWCGYDNGEGFSLFSVVRQELVLGSAGVWCFACIPCDEFCGWKRLVLFVSLGVK